MTGKQDQLIKQEIAIKKALEENKPEKDLEETREQVKKIMQLVDDWSELLKTFEKDLIKEIGSLLRPKRQIMVIQDLKETEKWF